MRAALRRALLSEAVSGSVLVIASKALSGLLGKQSRIKGGAFHATHGEFLRVSAYRAPKEHIVSAGYIKNSARNLYRVRSTYCGAYMRIKKRPCFRSLFSGAFMPLCYDSWQLS